MERIVFLERGTFEARFRAPAFEHQWVEHAETAPGEIVPRLTGATIAIVNKARIGRAELDQLPDLRMIAVGATGVDNVDLEACKARRVRVANARNYAAHAVAEHAFMMILALRRNLFAYREAVIAGRWQKARMFCLLAYPIADLQGAQLGIIGHGALGRATAALGRAFGMEVVIAEHKGKAIARPDRVAFDRVIEESDVISLHAPLSDATRKLIGQPELGRMKRAAILINTARGGLIDAHALRDAISAGTIGGAGIDVLEVEPPKDPDPLLELGGRPNVILTPHVAWASAGAMQAVADQVIDNIEAFVRGSPANLVV